MSVSLKQSYDVEYDGTHNVCRMDIFIDDPSDLTGLDNLDGIYFLQGSDALDISTGDHYLMTSSGSWILQPSSSAFSNVYTKAETDALFAAMDAKIYGHDSVQVNLNDITWYHSGAGLYYSEVITTMNLSKIYAVSLSGFANIRETDNIIPAVNRTGGWIGFRFYANTSSFASGAWLTVSGVGEV